MSPNPEDPPREFSSPPCYAGDFPEPAVGGAAVNELLIARLNALLEAERAGAKVLAILRDRLPEGSSLRGALEALQQDEGANAVQLYKAIQRLGGVASHETGAFAAKTLAIDGLAAQLGFLNKGQAWVVRKIDEALPGVAEDELRTMLIAMRRSHLDNIALCERLLAGGVDD